VEFALEWRKLYQPSMEEVRSGRRGWAALDVLHRESLDKLIARYAIKGLSEADIDHINGAWHRLDPWPDAVEGLTRVKRRFIIAPCSKRQHRAPTSRCPRRTLRRAGSSASRRRRS
jgi:2-haloacid dehalogenase